MASIPERFWWAARLLNIQPDDHILEIGCGAGLFAEVIASALQTGSLLAIDRSAPMVEKARKRNLENIERGVSKFVAGDFENSILPAAYYDSVVAFNVNFFSKAPAVGLAVIRTALKPHGNLYVFHQAPFEITIEAAAPIKQRLAENAFDIIDVKLQKLEPTSAFCIIAKPATRV